MGDSTWTPWIVTDGDDLGFIEDRKIKDDCCTIAQHPLLLFLDL
jgi:hypothetical protein